ncbi:MAG: glycosyltransferase family 2 protein [Deltaproteobacteria bacterium]|nr:glycosyltransferase family 2 protein [Deltaproteobacteria bacterium]
MRAPVIVPAYEASATVGRVVSDLFRLWPGLPTIFVVDDGSSDATAELAEAAGAVVLRHERNRGKGAALRTGLGAAWREGFAAAVSVDADGQHPAAEAWRLHASCADRAALVIGVRDLGAAGAPVANRLSNAFSNLVLSGFAGRRLRDTQCGLRRYPLPATIDLDAREDGYGYEAEILLRAVAAGLPIVERPVRVLYPPAGERTTHFHPARDPARIVVRVLRTAADTRTRSLRRRLARVRPRFRQ